MSGKRTLIVTIALFVMVVSSGWAATLEVSGATHMTANAEYDRNPSIVYDTSDYWLFWTKGDDISTAGVRGGGYNPDADTYVIYYKRAGTLAGLAIATETKLALSETGRPAGFDQRVVSATYFGGDIYAFASSGQSGTDRGLYYYKWNGVSWTGPTTLIADATAQGGHVNVTSDASYIYIVWEAAADASSDCYTWDGTTLNAKIDISSDNQPKIALDGTTLYVVSIEDGTGDIEAYSAAAGVTPVFSAHSTPVPVGGFYDPCIVSDGTDLHVITAPWLSGTDQQYLIETVYSGGSWSAANTVTMGGYGTTYWWDYWPVAYYDGSDVYVFFTTETASPSYSDGEIAMVKMDWDLANDHYLYVQNAVDAAAANDDIEVAAGTYVEQVTIDESLDLIGSGYASCFIEAPATRSGSVVQGTNTWDYIVGAWPTSGTVAVGVEGFTIDAAGQPKTGGTSGLVGVYMSDVDGTGAGLFDCEIEGFTTTEYESWGVRVHGDSDLSIDGNTLRDYTRDGIVVNGDGDVGADPDVALVDNDLTGSAIPLNGIQVAYGADADLTGNAVRNHTRSSPWAAVGIMVYQSDGVTVGAVGDGNTVTNCFDGILLFGSDGCDIVGNALVENIAFHIGLDGADNNVVASNTITGTAAGVEDKAIGISNGSTGNMIGGPVPADGNAITMAAPAAQFPYVIYVVGTVGSGSNTIQHNTLTGGTRFVQVDGGNSGTISVLDNTATGCTFSGVYLNGGSAVIERNTFTNTTRPVEFWGANNVTITDNLFDGASFEGVNAGAYSGTVTAIGNAFESIGGASLNNRVATHLDASGNWWGSAIPTVVASEVLGTVDYTPWLGAFNDTSTDPGYQGDYSVLWVDDCPQTGSTGRIQEGIDLVSGSTVNVADGTYTGPNTITDKNVTITGQSESGVVVEAATSPLSSSNVFTIAASGYDVTLEYMTIRNGRYGIRSSAGDVDVLHCTFYHNGYDGTPYPYPPTAANCATHWATYANDGGAVRLQSSGESEIAYCTVYDNDRGIRYQDGANGDIHDNVAHDNNQAGIYLAATTYSGATGCSDTEVYDNASYNNKEHGLLSIGGIGNTFEDNDLYDNWNAGVMMWHVADNMIAGNAISGNNLYSFNGWGAASDSKGAVCAVGTDWNTGGSYVFKLLGNDIANNFAGNAPTATGVRIGTSGNPVPAAGIEVKNNVFTGHDIDVHVTNNAALSDVNYNSFTGTSYGVFNEDTSKALLDAELNWWGAADGPSGAYSGSGVPVSTDVDYDPWIGKTGGENIVCDPDPLDLVVGSTTGSIDVDYLGGGGGMLYGYSVTVTWDVTKATLTGITEGGLLSDAGLTNFFVSGSGGTRTIDCTLTGVSAGVTGPGMLFTLAFSAAGSGTSTVDLGLVAFRDNGNDPLSGFYEDDGWINVDVTDPVFTDVSLANLTLGHTDAYAKNTDDLELTADVTDDYSLVREDIVADLSDLISGGATAEVAQTYDGSVATWTTALAGVTLTADGLQSVTVTATDWLGNSASDSDAITVDNTAPGTVSGLDAAPAHEEVVLLWDDASGAPADYYGVMVRYDVWNDYPRYDFPDPAPYPTDETEGVLAFSGVGTGTTFGVIPRDIHYFSAFVYDWALNYGTVTTAGQDRATNYWLGDVANTGDNWTPDGLVTVNDINKLGTLYGSAPSGDELKCDVGPTDDSSRVGIPEPDDMLNFEDLMIFAMNYNVVAAKVVPFLGEPGVGDLALALVENGRTNGGVLELALRVEGNAGDVKGLTAELEFEGLEFLSARLSNDMSSPMADMFFWSNATSHSVQVDAAVLGTDVTIGGSGDVVVFSFRVLDETYAVDFASATLRGAANEDLTAELEGLSSESVPVAFKLVQNSPNPFNPVTKVAYHVPHESRVTIRVFDVTGRLVTTLVDGVVEPGRHAAVWNGTNEHGESVGSGVYFCTMETPDYRDSHKMTLLK